MVTNEADKRQKARQEFGDKLKELQVAAGKAGSAAACARATGLKPGMLGSWFRGEVAPGRDRTHAARRLVEYLREQAGQPPLFDDGWARLLEAAQQEADERRGLSARRSGELRERADTWGITQHLAAPFRGGAELKATREFIRSRAPDAPSYLWWQGPPGAGKSALLSRVAAQASPDNTDTAAFFLSAAEGRDNAGAFVRTMVGQLTKVLTGKTPDSSRLPSPDELQDLYREAAARSAKEGRTLLLVVDGLDDDAAWRGGVSKRPSHSIASLLPEVPACGPLKSGATIRVLVAGRTVAEPPTDVPEGHPLRAPETIRLIGTRETGPGADHAVREALDRWGTSRVERTVLGLIAVAGAGLRASDLAELAGVGQTEAERLLRAAGGRYLIPDGPGVPPDGPAVEATVRAARERTDAATRDRCTEQLHDWAASWQGRGWPPDTPPYLLSRLPSLLHGTDLLVPYVLDPRRLSRMVVRGQGDEALAQIALVGGGYGSDLAVSFQVAVARALLASRLRRVPREFCGLFAQAGDAQRARELALSAPLEADRAVRLADAARALGGGPEAEDFAREAARWAGLALKDAPRAAESDKALEAVVRAGHGLRTIGLRGGGNVVLQEAGESMLRATVHCEALAWSTRVRAAQDLEPKQESKSKRGQKKPTLLNHMPSYAAELAARGPAEQVEALEIWAEVARSTREPAATAARDGVEAFCAGLEPESDLTHIELLALGACAVLPKRRRTGAGLALRAQRALLAAFTSPEALPDAARAQLALEMGPALTYTVRALYKADRPSDAKELLAAVPSALHRDLFDDDVKGEADRAAKKAASERDDELTRRAAKNEKARQAREKAEKTQQARKKAAPGDKAVRKSLAEEGGTVEDDVRNPPPPEYLTPEEHESLSQQLKVSGDVDRQRLAEVYARWKGHEPVADAGVWGLALAGALAATGHPEAAAKLAGYARGPADLAGVRAIVAMHSAVGGHAVAAGQYAQSATEHADATLSGLLAQAFAYAGEKVAARSWAEKVGQRPRDRNAQEWAAVAVTVGLARCAPEDAGILIGERLPPSRPGVPLTPGVPGMRDTALARMAALIPALPHPHAPDTAVHTELRRICGDGTRSEDIRQQNPHTALLLFLLHESGCCPGLVSEGQIRSWERYMTTTRLASGRPIAEWAVLQAVRGDVRAAQATVDLAETPEERAAALAAVATYLAGVPVIAPLAEGWSPQRVPVLRYLALADAVGPESSRDEAEARRLAQELLAGPHWRYALPLLPRLAPESAASLAELALAHMSP
ncbi:hypothetical protein [Streptomyces catenulae]|uniref:Nephrocystin 3-like N-terminal domain-containing protein n=1 Tax=Streptomyces catenulae TaxID=66875 RepID=A0ABV2YTR0_9ACTN|nr:hypothetical protein [Streptomyces catenulae]